VLYSYAFSDKLKGIIHKLRDKDQRRTELIFKKISQIINSDDISTEHFKNLRHGLSGRKRVHIDKSFVLTFTVDRNKKFILFVDFDHHDNIYKR